MTLTPVPGRIGVELPLPVLINYVTITGEGLQILTYARPSWPLICEGEPTVIRGIRL